MYFSFSILIFFATLFIYDIDAASNYFGKFLGSLKSYHHALGGDVYVVDSRTLHIRNFNYDGEGPAGYFYVANGKTPNENGIKLRDERGSTEPLRRYRKKHITLTLPEGKTISNIKWFYVWCDEFAVNFGDVKIPKNYDFPKPQKIGKLSGVHSVSSDNVVIVDAQTLLIPSFSYDGEAPDAKFWVGNGNKPTPQGIRVPDENGKEEPLRKYDKKTIVLTLPGDITVFDIGNFAIWCEAFTVDFGHIQIPKDVNVPPSLKMLGVSPQSKLNCEILYDDLAFEVRWAIAGESIVIQLVAKLEKGEYMSFGLSGQIDKNTMIGGDVVVAWIDHETLNGFAYDYYLDAKSQCAGSHGSCPDEKLQPNSENIRLLNAALVNGYSIVTYQRPLRAHDDYDLPIYTNGSQAIIWAIGPLNSLQEVSYHNIASKATILIDFGRAPQWNCPIPESDASVANSDTNENYESSTLSTVNEQIRVQTETTPRTRAPEQREAEVTKATTKKPEATPASVKREKPWDIPPIQCFEPEDGIFYAQMGPTGGKRGYSAITGHVGWGISWYINGLLIPEINVVRGRSYTFVVEGGLDPEIPAKYHPFYITDDPVGGFLYKTPDERAKVQVFAGITQNKAGEYVPTGVGRLCNWTPDPDQPPADEFASFGAYQRTLSLVCDHGEPGVVQWIPDENTPDTVYYQCFSHRYLGWKINVHDTCDKEGAESEQVTTRIRPNEHDRPDELLSNPSIQVETRVKPSNASVIRGDDFINPRRETDKAFPDGKHSFKDMVKNDYIISEQIILQDPYLPPPPYQKNFDYQSMQVTEPMKEVKTITDRVTYRTYSQAPSQPIKIQPTYYANVTKSYPVPAVKHWNYSQKESYAYKPALPVLPADYHAPAMHIHIIKHAGSDDNVESPIQKSFVSRPYRHSMAIKKPMHKLMPYTYPLRSLNKISKQTEPYVSGSVPPKSIIAPPLHNVIPKVPHTMLVSYATPQFSKKPFFSRKREESKSQHFTNRVEEETERKSFSGGFNPSSIVIESGFKPIIPNTETQNAAQERMSENAEDYIDQDAKESATEMATLAEDHSKNPFEGKEPELFEPMFIPSPVISEHLRKKKPHDETPKIKPHKSNQNNIVYIWPNEGVTNVPSKDSYYNYYSSDGAATSYYNSFDKNEHVQKDNDILDAHQAKPSKEPSHNYKVTEYDQANESLADEYNTTETISPLTSETQRKSEESTNYKIKYIPVGNLAKNLANDDKEFVIKVADREDVTKTSFKSNQS